jgi:uncharacterized membrane protein YfcA
MLSGIPIGELVFILVVILLAGAVSGLLSGLFGIGGSTVIIPVLYEVFRILGVPDGVRMQLCIGTALAIAVPTILRAYYAHRAESAVLGDVLRIWAVPAMLGVVAGSVIAYVAPGVFFKIMFVLFVIFMAVKLLFGRDTWRIAEDLPGPATMVAGGFAIGCLSALVGVAGGSLSTLFLALYGRPFHAAVATSTGLGVFIGIPATIGYMIAGWQYQALMPPFSIGYVSFLGLLLLAPASMLAAPYGARLAHRMSKRRLEVAFGIFLVLIALRFVASLVV